VACCHLVLAVLVLCIFPGAPWTNYRIYCINGTHVSAVNVIECGTDAAARDHASALLRRCGHSAAEVWDRDRFVCRIGRSDHPSHGCACGSAICASDPAGLS
jgi:hypothetical protein